MLKIVHLIVLKTSAKVVNFKNYFNLKEITSEIDPKNMSDYIINIFINLSTPLSSLMDFHSQKYGWASQ